jgi:hypothetical protein
MKITIYEKKQVVKTYEAEVTDLPFGVMEDLSEAFNFEKLLVGTDEDKATAVVDLLKNSKKAAYELLHEIFPEITDEEIRHASISDIAEALTDALTFSTNELLTGIKRSKNSNRADRR